MSLSRPLIANALRSREVQITHKNSHRKETSQTRIPARKSSIVVFLPRALICLYYPNSRAGDRI